MKRKRSANIIAREKGRVDKVAAATIPRSVFSLPSVTIMVNGKEVKKSAKVSPGDEIAVSWTEEIFESLEPEDIPLDVIYEDESILVINKEAGMVVHPGAGNWSGTLVNALLFRYGEDFSTYTGTELDDEESGDVIPRPGIVHRLDKDTSGVMVVARTCQAHSQLASQFASHTNEKVYVAIVKGFFTELRGTIEKRIARDPEDRKRFAVTDEGWRGKDAITHYQVIRQCDGYAFVRLVIETGRTHQIRVHMKSIGHPVLGDAIYSRPDSRFPDTGLCLHAMSLTIDHPATGKRMNFRAKLPERMRKVLKELFA